ncbi:hypothetical protein CH063_13857, partial [Colletotrichum higginsianum]
DFRTSSICSLTKSCHVGSSMPYILFSSDNGRPPPFSVDFQHLHARNITRPTHHPTMGNKPRYLESMPEYVTPASG